MGDPGSFGHVARLVLEAGLRTGRPLRSGETVRATVLKQLTPTKWLLGIRGRVVSAHAERTLNAGSAFFARVRAEGSTVYLEPYRQTGGGEAALRFLKTEGLPRDDLSLMILRAFTRSGLALDPERMRSVYAFFRHRGDASPRTVRAYLLMQEKGLLPSEEGFDRFIEALAGGGGEHPGGRRHGERRGGERHKGGDGRPAADVVREAVERREEEPGHLVHAFNHLRDTGGHWVVVPFGFQVDDTAYRGSIRMRFTGERPTFERAAVSLEAEEEGAGAWQFELVPARSDGSVDGGAGTAHGGSPGAAPVGGATTGVSGRGRLRVFYPRGTAPPQSLLGQLQSRLAPLGLGSVEVRSGEGFDGFSTEDAQDILKSIDTEA
ncbi:MAG: hypothetical protein ACLFRR_08580 [Spirochaetaceae bacterium]